MIADETRGERMTKEYLTKEDDRYVLLYTFASDPPGADTATPDVPAQGEGTEVSRV